MTLRAQVARPSTLADVIRQVSDAFKLMANATPIMVGRQFLKPGAGASPRVVFVPESARGKIEAPIEMGNSASILHTCEVHIRAKETGDDITRFANAYELCDLVIDCIQTAATGRLTWGDFEDDSPTDTDGPGAGLVFSFTYQRDMWHNARRWALDPAGTDTSAPVPHPPPGTLASGNTIAATTEPRNPDGT